MSALSRPISFRAGDIEQQIQERTADGGSPSLTAQRDLGRYYAMLARSLPTFTEPEASLIVDALNGLMLEAHTAHLLWANVDDAIRQDNLAEKWGVDGLALLTRLRSLTPFEALAVHDASERWRNGPYREADMDAALRSVGLVK